MLGRVDIIGQTVEILLERIAFDGIGSDSISMKLLAICKPEHIHLR
jgi:hypothetical protein